jgi:superfamily I DNA and/or RNA helicase
VSGHGASLPTVQYRMHPSIRAFPSQHFYDGKLKDCVNEDRHAPWHAECRFAPLCSTTSVDRSGSNSVAKAFVALLEALTRLMQREGGHMQKRIAVMSPYSRQCCDIRYRLSASGLQDVEVSSVDAFQGREMDVSVLSGDGRATPHHTLTSNLLRDNRFLKKPGKKNFVRDFRLSDTRLIANSIACYRLARCVRSHTR